MSIDSLAKEGGEFSGETQELSREYHGVPIDASSLQSDPSTHHVKYRERLSLGHFTARVAIVAGALIMVVAFASDRFGESTDNMTSELVKAREKVGDLQETVKQTRSDAVDGFCATINELQRTQDDASSLATKLDSLEQTAKSLGVVTGSEITNEVGDSAKPSSEEKNVAEVPERLTRFVKACQDKS